MTRKCPECGNRSAVIDSRETEITVRRQRECVTCKRRWTTWETIVSPETVLAIMRKSMQQITRAARLGELALADLDQKRNSGKRPVTAASKCRPHATGVRSDSRGRVNDGV
jgi:transcriptional regulator NrdR family protein